MKHLKPGHRYWDQINPTAIPEAGRLELITQLFSSSCYRVELHFSNIPLWRMPTERSELDEIWFRRGSQALMLATIPETVREALNIHHSWATRLVATKFDKNGNATIKLGRPSALMSSYSNRSPLHCAAG